MTRSPGSLTSSSASSVCSSCEEEPVAPRSPPEPAPAADWAADKNVPVQAGGDLLAALVEHRPEAPLHLVGVHQPEFFHDVRLQPTVEGELVWLNYVSSLAEGFLLAQLNGSIFTHLSVAENSKRPVFNNWLIQTSIFPGMALGSIFDPLTRRVLDARTSVIMCIGGLCLCCVSTVISLDPIAIAWERFIAGLLLGKTCALIVLFTARSTAFVDSTKFCLARNIGLVGGGFMAALVSLVFLFHVDEYESTAAAGVTVMKSRVSAITPPVLDRVWVRCTALVPMSLLVLALWIFLRRLRYLSPSEYVARKDFANAKAMILNLYDLGSQASQATQEMTPGTVGTKADALVEIVAAQNFSASRVVGRGVWRSTVRGFTMEATGHKALIASSAYLLAKAGISFKWSLLITFIAMLLGCVMALLNTMVLLRFVDRKVLLLAGALTQTSVAASLAVRELRARVRAATFSDMGPGARTDSEAGGNGAVRDAVHSVASGDFRRGHGPNAGAAATAAGDAARHATNAAARGSVRVVAASERVGDNVPSVRPRGRGVHGDLCVRRRARDRNRPLRLALIRDGVEGEPASADPRAGGARVGGRGAADRSGAEVRHMEELEVRGAGAAPRRRRSVLRVRTALDPRVQARLRRHPSQGQARERNREQNGAARTLHHRRGRHAHPLRLRHPRQRRSIQRPRDARHQHRPHPSSATPFFMKSITQEYGLRLPGLRKEYLQKDLRALVQLLWAVSLPGRDDVNDAFVVLQLAEELNISPRHMRYAIILYDWYRDTDAILMNIAEALLAVKTAATQYGCVSTKFRCGDNSFHCSALFMLAVLRDYLRIKHAGDPPLPCAQTSVADEEQLPDRHEATTQNLLSTEDVSPDDIETNYSKLILSLADADLLLVVEGALVTYESYVTSNRRQITVKGDDKIPDQYRTPLVEKIARLLSEREFEEFLAAIGDDISELTAAQILAVALDTFIFGIPDRINDWSPDKAHFVAYIPRSKNADWRKFCRAHAQIPMKMRASLCAPSEYTLVDFANMPAEAQHTYLAYLDISYRYHYDLIDMVQSYLSR